MKRECIKWMGSYDNDLGLDESGEVAPDGYAAAKWLVQNYTRHLNTES